MSRSNWPGFKALQYAAPPLHRRCRGMAHQSPSLRELPPVFLIGVLLNWAGVGVLALRSHPIVASGALLAAGTLLMFLGAYIHRQRSQQTGAHNFRRNQEASRR